MGEKRVRAKHLWLVYRGDDVFPILCVDKTHATAVVAMQGYGAWGYHLVKVAPTYWLLVEQMGSNWSHWHRYTEQPSRPDDFLHDTWAWVVNGVGLEW